MQLSNRFVPIKIRIFSREFWHSIFGECVNFHVDYKNTLPSETLPNTFNDKQKEISCQIYVFLHSEIT